MTLTTEDGTGLANAESYCSVADADTYHTNFGNTTWTGSTAAKEIALRKATRWLDVTWNGKWKGRKNTTTQGLDWPRYWAEDADGFSIQPDSVPTRLRDACAEAALRVVVDGDL